MRQTHIVNQTVLIPDAELFKFRLVFSAMTDEKRYSVSAEDSLVVDLLELIFPDTIISFENGVLG